jgi:hypothetical protein
MNNSETSTPRLDMRDEVKMSILNAIRTNDYYSYACVFYEIYLNDIALLSEDNDVWVHRVNTASGNWEIVEKSHIVNLYKEALTKEITKLIDYYQSQVKHDSCPYAQTVDTLKQAIITMSPYGHSVIDESAKFFQVDDIKHFLSNYLTHENLVEFTECIFKNSYDI